MKKSDNRSELFDIFIKDIRKPESSEDYSGSYKFCTRWQAKDWKETVPLMKMNVGIWDEKRWEKWTPTREHVWSRAPDNF